MIDLDAVIVSAQEMEPLPQSVSRLAILVAQPEVDFGEIEQTIALDGALTGRLLKAANAASSGARAEITSVKMAATRLGTGAILSLAMSTCVKGKMTGSIPAYGMSEGSLWSHSVTAALAAEELQRRAKLPPVPELFTAALLHDIGKLVLGRFLEPATQETLRRAHVEGQQSLVEAEYEVLATHHGEVGGLVAQKWGLPEGIIDGITHHHHAHEREDKITATVAVANVMAHHVEALISGTPLAEIELDDQPAARERLGVTREKFEEIAGIIAERFEEISAKYA